MSRSQVSTDLSSQHNENPPEFLLKNANLCEFIYYMYKKRKISTEKEAFTQEFDWGTTI